tara:strand:- start:9291 stop:11681 length:2391 start_codon:yes stop_codon:yes gene_type:complete
MKVTIFKNIKNTSQPFYVDVSQILSRIQEGKSKDLVKRIRLEKDKSKRNLIKQLLPAICFSGQFTKRNDNSLNVHSGLICLDFDGYTSNKELLQEKERLSKNKFVYSVFVSPSGLGLKALVKIPTNVENHKGYFLALQKHFDSPNFDTTSKNVSRVCYESYDPLIYVNTISSIWDSVEVQEYTEVTRHQDMPTIPITDENKIVEILLKWWNKKYGMVDGERNNNVYILAAAFNDFGINQTLAEYIINRFATKDFNENEVKRTIRSAYSNKHNFGTKYYQDEDRISQVREKLKRGVSKKEIRSQLKESNIEVGVADNVINKLEEEQANHKFWTKNEKGTIKIVHILFKNFLEENGFYKFNPEGSKSYVFVRVTNNLIDHTSEKELKDFILNYLEGIDDYSVYNYFAENTRYFREEFLTLLASIDVYFIEDNKDTAYLYYKNSAVKITKDKVLMIDYLDLGGYVWKDHVIDRTFNICDIKECDYRVFISNICKSDAGRIESMRSTIGYLLHGWKNLSYSPATILNDEVISENPEGGTGKGLFMNGLSHMKKLVVIDGKSFNFDKSFAYQLVSADTQILCFDDVKKSFDFERLFSVVTEGLTLEKKNQDSIKIPFSKSPKVAITTNYAINGEGTSFERRKWELELTQHYTKDFTPLVEFGKLMFGEWDDDEWCQFDNYMISNLQLYLGNGLLKSVFINLEIRKLSRKTSYDFMEWCGILNKTEKDKFEIDKRMYMNDFYNDYTTENNIPAYGKDAISRTKFNKWLLSYAAYKDHLTTTSGRDMIGKWFTFSLKKRGDEI